MATFASIAAKLDEVNKLWDVGIPDYDDDEDDDKESSVGDETNCVNKGEILEGSQIDKGSLATKVQLTNKVSQNLGMCEATFCPSTIGSMR